jgi:hypothetical protein
VTFLAGAPIFLAGPFGVVVLAVLAYTPLQLRDTSVELHAAGLVLCKGGERRAVPFSEVDEVWFELARVHNQAGAQLHAVRLVDFGGVTHHVSLALEGAAALAGVVLREISGPLLAEARAALGEGATLTFGRIRLDRDAITSGKKRLPWGSIGLVVFQRGKVFFYRRWPIFPALTVRLDRIPNPTVFGGLVTRCARRVRVDDQILIPFATGAEATRAVVEQGEDALALRLMLTGGVWCLCGLAITWVTYASHADTYVFAYGPILFGAIQFFRGLAAYRSGPRR